MNTNQCAHTVDTYKLVSIPPEKKKEAQPRREKNMQKQIVTKKKKLQKIRKLKATKQI
jgi:Skp family chaperone for outer membrane proteins